MPADMLHTKTLLLFSLLLVTCSCKHQAYQTRVTKQCEAHHTVEQCKALSYPACDPDSKNCHN